MADADVESPRADIEEKDKAVADGLAWTAEDELALRWKIDLRVFPVMIILFILNFIDRNNFANARLKGLEEDLRLTDVEYQTCISILLVGYIAFQIPSNMILNILRRPSWYLCACAALWGAISAVTATVQNATGAILCRFFLGCAEASLFPGSIYFLSRWYTRREMQLRVTLLNTGNLVAQAFGGLIAAGILGRMEGTAGIRAWRWLFILEGVITIAFAVVAVFILPDYPSTTSWLSDKEKMIAQHRLNLDVGADTDTSNATLGDSLQGLKQAMTDPKVWLLGVSYHCTIMGLCFVYFFPTITQSLGFETTTTLLLTAPPWIWSVFIALPNAWHADRTGERFFHYLGPALACVVGYVIAMTTRSTAPRYISMFLMTTGYASGFVMLAWISSTIPRPPAKRAAAIGIINAMGNIGSIPGSYIFPAKFGPYYVKSFGAELAILAFGCVCAFTLRTYLRYLNKKLEQEERVVESGKEELAGTQRQIKCDGEDPCHNCQSREQLCEFQDSNDNASASRRYAASFEERCQHMDNLCKRLEGLAQTLTDCIATAQKDMRQETLTQLTRAAEAHTASSHNDAIVEVPDLSVIPDRSPAIRSPEFGLGSLSESSGNVRHDTQSYPTPVDPVGHMVADSYGRLRYIGGATNNMMIEAIQSISPGGTSRPVPSKDNGDVSLPFFIQGQVWPEMPFLPQPKELARPPQYVSDLLVGIYFDQLHYTFPILYKPDFMRRYQQMNSGKRDAPVGRGFLSVFFAVCACASSLLPRAPGSAGLPGIEYYQKALLLHFASFGEAFIEQVQCLGLLALCSAGWNTLSQSWRFAGQAVRVAQDLGLHVSSLRGASGNHNSAAYIEAQVARCTWWSVFTLDCLMSICLGRPMAADEADSCCDLPFNVSNEDLEQFGLPEDPHSHTIPSPMTGFLAFTRLCRIAARVHRFYSSNRIRSRETLADNWASFLPTLDVFVRELDDWLQELPNDIRFSANSTQSGPNLTMCVIVFMLHSGTIMNLYRPIAANQHNPPSPTLLSHLSSPLNDPSTECINAARSCIHAAELIRERVPPSHHLAFCVQYLTISGILLLSMTDETKDSEHDLLPHVQSARRFLGDLEAIWPGASRSREILDRLLQNPGTVRAKGRVPTHEDGNDLGEEDVESMAYNHGSTWFPSLPVLDGLLWEHFPDPSEVFLNLNNFG
ncbi:major facilitator superfamily domain-containing protein [Aspergillus karnatakaensis]|uniref:MFS transporter/GAL4/fungal specific transcription factor domain-containing protein n=1 Tax=Aspergillus karnatakaensis TaxID=1810916 RepID=UPI003CCC939D